MRLSDFYDIFPEYKHAQFAVRYIRNEIFIVIQDWHKPEIIIDYFNDNKVEVALKDSKLIFNKTQQQDLQEKYHYLSFTKENNPMIKTDMKHIKSDLDYLSTVILKSTLN